MKRGRIWVLVVLVPVLCVLGMVGATQLSLHQRNQKVTAAADTLQVPPSWKLVRSDFTPALSWCTTTCPLVSRHYQAEGTTWTDLDAVIRQSGWEVQYEGDCEASRCMATGEADGTQVIVSLLTDSSTKETSVSVYVG